MRADIHPVSGQSFDASPASVTCTNSTTHILILLVSSDLANAMRAVSNPIIKSVKTLKGVTNDSDDAQ
ncbi:MAG: hypothetical protein ACR2OA_04175 [Rubripirellula sp.]